MVFVPKIKWFTDINMEKHVYASIGCRTENILCFFRVLDSSNGLQDWKEDVSHTTVNRLYVLLELCYKGQHTFIEYVMQHESCFYYETVF